MAFNQQVAGDVSAAGSSAGLAVSVNKVAGVTPGTTGLAVLDDATAAAARDTVVWASAAAIDPASPYTVIAGIDRVTFASSKTLAPRALANYADGQTILVTNSSTSTITVTITPADGTIDGGASVALSVAAHGVVGCQRVSASAWVSLQPGSGVSPGRLKAYISGGNPLCVVQGWDGSTWVDIGSAVAPDTTQADAAATITPSGTGFTSAAGYTPASDKRSTAWLALWTLSGAGTLGKTWTPTSTGTTVNLETTCDQPAVASYFAGVVLGHATTATTWTFGVAYGGSAAGVRHVTGISDDDAVTSGACTAAAPAYALLSTAATTGARSYYTGGRTSTNVVEDAIAAPGNSLASPAFGLIAMRPATGGGTLTVTAFEAYFYFGAGELT